MPNANQGAPEILGQKGGLAMVFVFVFGGARHTHLSYLGHLSIMECLPHMAGAPAHGRRSSQLLRHIIIGVIAIYAIVAVLG